MDVIQQLIEKTKDDAAFNQMLLASLVKAKDLAQAQLGHSLFEALSWPITIEAYHTYLLQYAKWLPKEISKEVWRIPNSNGHQQVDDRLNHFYFLINQKVGKDDSTIVQNIPWFSQWLSDYSISWGTFLDTTALFNKDTLNSFIENASNYRVEDSMVKGKPNNPSGWLTFNQFFARELNPGLRPIANPSDNTVVVTPADCNYRAQYKINADSSIPEITIKNKHKFANIHQLLEGSQYKDEFANGTFIHYFLSPFSYHRFHTPVAGLVKECYPIHGLVYCEVGIKDKQFDAPDNSEDGYQFAQARGVITIDTAKSLYGNVGIVAVIPIGMCQVSSVHMIAAEDKELLKGDEFGYFRFGGSDIIVLFQEGANPQIDINEDYRHYGNKMAKCKKV